MTSSSVERSSSAWASEPDGVVVRPFAHSDGDAWVRCRVLSFLSTAYFDDVKTTPTAFANEAIRLVATIDDVLVGLIDVEIDAELATIDSIAVSSAFRQRGIATALANSAISSLPSTVRTLDAWTRDDAEANAWYRGRGFTEEQHYLHVYKSPDQPDDEVGIEPNLRIVGAFMHATLGNETELRRRFKRIHVCRRYVIELESHEE